MGPARGRARIPTSLHEEDVAALRTAGVLRQDGIDDDVRAVLAGLARAGVHIELAVTRPSGHEMHRVWAATDTATLAAQLGEDAYDVLALPPSLVVPALARLMPLEPRPLLPADDEVAPDSDVFPVVTAPADSVPDSAPAASQPDPGRPG